MSSATKPDLGSSVGDYAACWDVARAAHQFGLHGILAPSTTNLGETLALFDGHLPAAEQPELLTAEVWDQLPADPRRLRVVRDESK